jgi:hypothetical protein
MSKSTGCFAPFALALPLEYWQNVESIDQHSPFIAVRPCDPVFN